MGCTDSTNTALVFFMLQSVSSSYTFNFNEQILPDLQHDHVILRDEMVLCEDKLQPTWTVMMPLYRLQKHRCATLVADYTPTHLNWKKLF